MNNPECSLQGDLFTGELIDTRTAAQKKRDRLAQLPQQEDMFTARDGIYERVNPTPHMPIPDHVPMRLEWTDPRTLEEIERDRQREAEKRTIPLFVKEAPPTSNDVTTTASPLVTDPRRLLAANSVVSGDRDKDYLANRKRVEGKAEERLLYLRLLYAVLSPFAGTS